MQSVQRWESIRLGVPLYVATLRTITSEMPPVYKLNVSNIQISKSLNVIDTCTHFERSRLNYKSCVFHNDIVFLLMRLKVFLMVRDLLYSLNNIE